MGVQLIDAQTRLLAAGRRVVLAALRGLEESGEHPKMRHELMQSTVEVVTGICGTVAEAKADLAMTIKELQRYRGTARHRAGRRWHAPVSDWRDAKMAPSQRYAELVEQIQWPARRLQTMATHVHVGLRDADRAMPIVNALAVYLPHLLALTASSPYWSGTTPASPRAGPVVFGALPNTGPPPGLPDWKSFEDYMDTQLRAGTIRTIKEVWWDVRPHPDFGTIEIQDRRRGSDAPRGRHARRDRAVPRSALRCPARPRLSAAEPGRRGCTGTTSGGPPGTDWTPS